VAAFSAVDGCLCSPKPRCESGSAAVPSAALLSSPAPCFPCLLCISCHCVSAVLCGVTCVCQEEARCKVATDAEAARKQAEVRVWVPRAQPYPRPHISLLLAPPAPPAHCALRTAQHPIRVLMTCTTTTPCTHPSIAPTFLAHTPPPRSPLFAGRPQAPPVRVHVLRT
jgi:hypothetical protein